MQLIGHLETQISKQIRKFMYFQHWPESYQKKIWGSLMMDLKISESNRPTWLIKTVR